MVNRARGEVPFVIEGETYRLCLTLGALAEIEAGLGAEDLGALETALARPRLAHLMILLQALLRGGGHEIDERTLKSWQIDVAALGRAIGAAFAAAGLGAPQETAPGEDSAPRSPHSALGSGGAGLPSVSASWEWQPTRFGG